MGRRKRPKGSDAGDTIRILDEGAAATDKVAIPEKEPPKRKKIGKLDAAPKRSRVGPYDVRRILGAGGMGVVYGARSTEGEDVAVKVLYNREGDGLRRFRREANVRIESPHIVKVLTTGEDEDGLPYIVFELLRGEPLSVSMERGPVAPAVAIDVGLQALKGLAAAHAAGIVHRDIKPSNLFRTEEGLIKILDFGVAIFSDQGARITQSGGIVGTPMYLSPEQACGDPGIDEATDLWSLGVVLYELLTGKTPFLRDTAIATLLAIVRDEAPPVATIAPEVPQSLASVVDRALEKDRRRRWRTAAELRDALLSIETSNRSPSRIVAPPEVMPSGEQRLVAVMLAEGVKDIDVVRAAVEARGGALVPLVGQRALGLFGAERWEGDEIHRAALAAFESRLVAKSVAVAAGHASRSAGGISGDALALAEAGCAKGLEGVAADAKTAKSLEGVHRVVPCDDQICEMFQDREASTVLALRMVPLLARDGEVAEMRARFSRALESGGAQPILVIGPAGIGKTRLLYEMEKIVSEHFVFAFVARGASQRQRVTFSLMASLVSTVVDPDMSRSAKHRVITKMVRDAIEDESSARETSTFICELLDVAPDGEVSIQVEAARADAGLMQDRLRMALLDLFIGIGRERMLVILADDLQWADEASLELIQELEAELGSGLFFFGTARTEFREERDFFSSKARVLEPSGLSLADVRKLAVALVGRTYGSDLLEAVAERAGGNPLFVEQILLAIEAEGSPRGEVPLPLTVEAAIQSRLDHLPAPEKNLLKRAAVFGRPFVLEEVEHLAPGARPLLASLVRRGILNLRSRGDRVRRYRFASAMVEEVSYRMLSDTLRVELHRSAAVIMTALEGTDQEDVGRHFDLGRDPEKAATSYARAAILASRRGDSPSVLRCSDRAIELGVPRDLGFATSMARSEALFFLGRRSEQAEVLEAAIESASTVSERAAARTELGWCLVYSRDLGRAVPLLDEAIREARDARDPNVLARALGRSVVAMIYAGRLEDAVVRLDQAFGVQGVSPATSALLAGFRAQLASAEGDPGARSDAFADAIRRYEEVGDRRRAAAAATNLADVWNRVGAYVEAGEALVRALADCKRVGHRPMEGFALLNLAYSLMMQNKATRAVASLQDALEIALETKDKRLELWCRVYRARAELGGIHPNASAEALELVANEALAAQLPSVRVAALCVASRFLLQAKDIEGAVELSGRALGLRDEMGGVEEDEADVFAAHAAALEANGQKAEARAVRKRGRERVEAIARRIDDDQWRFRFLRGVPAHEALGVDPDVTAL